MRKLFSFRGRHIGGEGLVIFSLVAYETIALTANFVCNEEKIKPITGILGPLTHSKAGKIIVWLLMGWSFDHFYARGEHDEFVRKIAELSVGNNE